MMKTRAKYIVRSQFCFCWHHEEWARRVKVVTTKKENASFFILPSSSVRKRKVLSLQSLAVSGGEKCAMRGSTSAINRSHDCKCISVLHLVLRISNIHYFLFCAERYRNDVMRWRIEDTMVAADPDIPSWWRASNEKGQQSPSRFPIFQGSVRGGYKSWRYVLQLSLCLYEAIKIIKNQTKWEIY